MNCCAKIHINGKVGSQEMSNLAVNNQIENL